VYVASTFTPDTSIRLTRVQAQFVTPPSGCTRNAVIRITDGTPAGTVNLTVTAVSNDSGPLSVNYVAGIPIRMGVITSALCSQPPQIGNVAAQYKAQ
jgi:hypothetical protein